MMEVHSMIKEIQEYKQLEAEFKDTLETQFQVAHINQDGETAYNILGELMAFKLIDEDDLRIEKTNKSYSKYGIAKDHRFRLDYRRGISYIPEWLFGRLPLNRSFTVKSIEHMGKRVEGNYSGDAFFPSHSVTIQIKQCNTVKQVENGFEDIERILKASKTKMNLDQALECAKQGVYRLYHIEIQGNCISRYKTVGYALIALNEVYKCSLILRYESITHNWIPVNGVLGEIQNVINGMLSNPAQYAYPIDVKVALDEQKAMLNWSNSLKKTQ